MNIERDCGCKKIQRSHSPIGPFRDSAVDTFELALLFTLAGGLEAMVCRLVTADTCPDRACVTLDGAALLMVLAEV